MTKKLIPLVIDRERWTRGLRGNAGEAMLRNTQGNQCCLGFACAALGVDEKDLQLECFPQSISDDHPKVMEVLCDADNMGRDKCRTKLAQLANDNEKISENEREKRVKKHLTKLGFKVTFTGKKNVVYKDGKMVPLKG